MAKCLTRLPAKEFIRGLKSLSRLQVDVAQTAERFLRNEEVGGATPLVGSMPVKHIEMCACLVSTRQLVQFQSLAPVC